MNYDDATESELSETLALPRVVVIAETGSTLDVAHTLAEQGAAPGTLVVADRQTAGRGRMGRAWSSPPGQGVWCTVVERPRDTRALDVLSLRVGLLIAESLDEVARGQVGLKWPNDLLLPSGKLGGILCETRWAGQTPAWVAVGVGINVAAPLGVDGASGLPAGTKRLDILTRVVRAIRAAAANTGHLEPDEMQRFAGRDALLGRRIASPATGVVAGIDATGALLVDTAGSGRAAHRSGTVVLQEHA